MRRQPNSETLPTLHELLAQERISLNTDAETIVPINEAQEKVTEAAKTTESISNPVQQYEHSQRTAQHDSERNPVLAWSRRKALLDFFNIETASA